MEIKVRALDGIEAKSTQEIEKELLDKHEESIASEGQVKSEDVKSEDEDSIQEGDVLSFINKRYNKEINSVDDLFQQVETNDDLPEDVSAYFKYKKETGRGLDDFVRLNKDYDSLSDEQVLTEYYLDTEDGLDKDDVTDLIENKFYFDEDLDEESDIKKIKLEKKRELAKAKKHLNQIKEKYSAPLESRGLDVPEEDKEAYDAYKKYVSESKTVQEKNKRSAEWFNNETSKVFSDEFKGFEFKVNDNNIRFSPGDAKELKSKQSDIMNFISKFTNDDGMMSDAKGYHKALSVAMNPDKFAKFFYEQGMADAVEDQSKKSKNINMDVRSANQLSVNSGFKARALSSSSGNGLKIKSIKRT
jgi:hypothetical protein